MHPRCGTQLRLRFLFLFTTTPLLTLLWNTSQISRPKACTSAAGLAADGLRSTCGRAVGKDGGPLGRRAGDDAFARGRIFVTDAIRQSRLPNRDHQPAELACCLRITANPPLGHSRPRHGEMRPPWPAHRHQPTGQLQSRPAWLHLGSWRIQAAHCLCREARQGGPGGMRAGLRDEQSPPAAAGSLAYQHCGTWGIGQSHRHGRHGPASCMHTACSLHPARSKHSRLDAHVQQALGVKVSEAACGIGAQPQASGRAECMASLTAQARRQRSVHELAEQAWAPIRGVGSAQEPGAEWNGRQGWAAGWRRGREQLPALSGTACAGAAGVEWAAGVGGRLAGETGAATSTVHGVRRHKQVAPIPHLATFGCFSWQRASTSCWMLASLRSLHREGRSL